ncbi:MAG: gamma-glutamyl-gamma-aminobutyrate hydrolase family protein [Clostridia bacterium]|nr:gamma-glutamyl-gamma-aminobutyrate hydrolase family protein [Clostridia bacterium]
MNNKRKPLIGITPTFDGMKYTLYYAYCAKIAEMGGIPVILPAYFNDVSVLDGIVFSGGGDLSPAFAGYENSEILDDVNEGRDEFESRLFVQANEAGIPILGICRGHQLVNVMLGGTLHRDINEAGYNERHMLLKERGSHTVYTEPNTVARQVLGNKKEIWSSHHQAVNTVGKGVRVTARSEEGIVEAIEHENGRILGLQTHPERMDISEPFEWLVKKAKEYMGKK